VADIGELLRDRKENPALAGLRILSASIFPLFDPDVCRRFFAPAGRYFIFDNRAPAERTQARTLNSGDMYEHILAATLRTFVPKTPKELCEDGRESQCRAETSPSVRQSEHQGPMPMNIHHGTTGPSVVGQIVLAVTVGFGRSFSAGLPGLSDRSTKIQRIDCANQLSNAGRWLIGPRDGGRISCSGCPDADRREMACSDRPQSNGSHGPRSSRTILTLGRGPIFGGLSYARDAGQSRFRSVRMKLVLGTNQAEKGTMVGDDGLEPPTSSV
jgi:hypothetical protein